MKSLITLLTCCCLAILLVSCSSKPASVSEPPQLVDSISRIAVLPVRTLAEEGSQLSVAGTAELKSGALYSDTILREELAGNPKAVLVYPADLDRVTAGVTGGLAATIASLGSDLGCDAVLLTTIRRYKQRMGGEYAVDAPASASFQMRLVETATQRVIWVADFNETQESLLSNILSFGKAQSRGFKWITVEDLTAQGLRERLAECPYF